MKVKSFLTLFILLFPFVIFAQEKEVDIPSEKKPTIFQNLFTTSEVPEVVLTTDIKKILKNKFAIQAIPAKLEYTKDGKLEEWNINLTARGKSRRRICYMPPLKMEFPKDSLKERRIRKKHNTLKLVSYCKDRSNYEGYILREYIAYKIYNILTDYSFKVQLVKIEYRDSFDHVKPVRRLGFMIEDTDELAERLDAKEKNKYDCRRDSLNHKQYDCLALFQYMIGNTDWKINVLHNTKVIQNKFTRAYYAIPYDFDYSGLVNTVYSIPHPDLNQSMASERVFLGDCTSADDLEEIRQHFIKCKDQIFNMEELALMKKGDRKRMLKYLRDFYKTLENKNRFKKFCLKRAQSLK